MTGPPSQSAPRSRRTEWIAVLWEASLVLAAGVLFGWVANQFSPRGLKLARDYFPQITSPVPAPAPPLRAAPASPDVKSGGETNAIVIRLRRQGLQVVEGGEALKLYHDPQYAQELILFVDARNDAHYLAGHVPGAYPFDHYHPENYLPALFTACRVANKIVVYCAGGDCEDSEFAAVTLNRAGVPLEKLFVYVGGFTEWASQGWPVELGQRRSGVYKEAGQ